MTQDTKIILRELAAVETGIAILIEKQDAILEHFQLKEPNIRSSAQLARHFSEAINGIKKRLRENGIVDEI